MYYCIVHNSYTFNYYFPFFLLLANCTDGEVRLVGGANQTEGRVEICSNNEWGTICDDQWGTEDAQVICRQLGFDTEG